MADVHAELKRAADRARRAVLKEFPPGSTVAWTDPYRRTLDLVGVVKGVEFCRRTGAAKLAIRVTEEAWTGKSKGLYSEVGVSHIVDPDRARLVVAPPV